MEEGCSDRGRDKSKDQQQWSMSLDQVTLNGLAGKLRKGNGREEALVRIRCKKLGLEDF